jgi:lipopolysaccharide transport protein LptA
MKLFIILFLNLILFVDIGNSKTLNKNLKIPTKIRSDIIDIKQKSLKIDFINNVMIEKGDDLILAKKVTLFYNNKSDKKTNNNFEIKEIKAYENIKFFNDEYNGSSDLATFNPNKNILILEKNVIINNGTSVLKGEKFIYDLATKKGNFEGNNIINKNSNLNQDNRIIMIIGDDINKTNNKIKSK